MKTVAHIALCTLAGLLGYQIRQLFSITGKALGNCVSGAIGAPGPDRNGHRLTYIIKGQHGLPT